MQALLLLRAAAELAELAISSPNHRTNFAAILVGFGDRDWVTSRFSRVHYCGNASTPTILTWK